MTAEEMAGEIYKSLDERIVAMPYGTGRSAAIENIAARLRPHFERHAKLREAAEAVASECQRMHDKYEDPIYSKEMLRRVAIDLRAALEQENKG